jgi:hypothetical protein
MTKPYFWPDPVLLADPGYRKHNGPDTILT